MRRFIGSLVLLCCLTSVGFAQSRNLTVLVNSDTHFGASSSVTYNRAAIQAMNGIAGTAYPASIGGIVGTPSGVIVAGDLTDGALRDQWDDYKDHYPLNGGTGVNEIHYPVKELTGNHDRKEPWYYFGDTPVRDGVEDRQGSLKYSWDWDGVHFASLDLYPSVSASNWLANDLGGLEPQTPVVLFTHYGFDSYGQGWWDNWGSESQYFKNTIEDHNVIGIIHGHGHFAKTYTWEGYDVYTPGSPKTTDVHNFGVMNIKENQLTWAEYGYELDGSGNWVWVDEKTFVPEPTCLLIMGITGLGLLGKRRKKIGRVSV